MSSSSPIFTGYVYPDAFLTLLPVLVCRMNNLVADRLLMVYDMRVMRAMAPIQVSIDSTFLRFVPALSNHLIVVSQVREPTQV